jgi:hypothetical protein
MKTPCDACPFLNENKDMLTHSRRRGISDSIHHDGDFPCHKTVDYTGEGKGVVRIDSKRCTGAAIYLEHTAKGGLRANMMFRLALMIKEFSMGDLDISADVPRSVEAFISD